MILIEQNTPKLRLMKAQINWIYLCIEILYQICFSNCLTNQLSNSKIKDILLKNWISSLSKFSAGSIAGCSIAVKTVAKIETMNKYCFSGFAIVLSFYRLFTDLPVNYFYRFTSKLWLVKIVKMVKREMNGYTISFLNNFFSFQKNKI